MYIIPQKGYDYCPACDTIMPLSEFYYNPTYHIYSSRCKECLRKQGRQKTAKKRAKKQQELQQQKTQQEVQEVEKTPGEIWYSRYRLKNRLRTYGLTMEDYRALRETQEGKCKICLIALDENEGCIDHCHKTGKVRGLLCQLCNQGLGRFRDDPERLRRAIEYLAQ